MEKSDPLDASGSSSIWDKPVVLDDDAVAIADLTLSPMLKRYPTFVPLRRHATSIAEVTFLVPSSNSSLRSATVMAATFNMTATIVGGGVLSIPLSCARAGILPFTLLMIVSAIATDFSLYLLVSCARRCGSTSFGKVSKAAYGSALEMFTTAVIFFLVGCIIVGLMILNQGIWTPIVLAGIASFGGETDEGDETTKFQDAVVLLVLLGLMMHYLLKRDLSSLRHICYVGFFSIAVLCATMVYRAAEKNLSHSGLFRTNVKWVASSFADVLNALPIILLAFLCSFNIISVHCSLVDPTRGRVREVIHKSVMFSFLLMCIFGVSGYLYSYDNTDGNILLCFDPKDPVIFLGRIGCGITTLFALPMNALPCREALLSLLAQISEARARRRATKEEQRQLLDKRRRENERGTCAPGVNKSFHKSRTMPTESNVGADDENGYGTSGNVKKTSRKGTVDTARPGQTNGPALSETFIHRIATFGIVFACYVAAVLAPGVAIVWDIAGSSMAFLIQFIIPATCYIKLKLRTGKSSKHLVMAYLLMAFAVVMAALCTAQTAWRLATK